MRFGLGLCDCICAYAVLAIAVTLLPASRLFALEKQPPKPPVPNVKPDATPLNDPGTGAHPTKIPDAFAPRLNEADDDKDPPIGETVVLPPSPNRNKPPETGQHARVEPAGPAAIKPLKPTEPVWVYDPQALQIHYPKKSVAKTPDKTHENPAPPKPRETIWVYDPWALAIDFAMLQTGLDSKRPESPELKLPDLDPDQLDVTLLVDSPMIKPGADASFTLSGPDEFMREVSGEYLLGDDLGRQLAQGKIVFSKASGKGQSRNFKLASVADLLLATDKYKSGGAGLKLHADFEFFSPGKKIIKLGGDFSIDLTSEPRAKEWDRWIALNSSPPANGDWSKLNDLGIFGGMQIRTSAARRESLRRGNAPFYVENVTRQMLSRYHTEKGLWQKTITTISADRNGSRALVREPSLCAQTFADAFGSEIQRVSEAYVNDSPLFFSLSSEPSITRLNAAADFDFSPAALDEFRRWLERDEYGTLQALNEGWGTHFESWQAVVPMTTDDARSRLKEGIGNFAPWADFREFQDFTFAKVLREGADLLRTKIPGARVGITGAMGPFAFGGWDWSRLAAGLDVVEAYDIGGARSLWRDLATGKPAVAALTLPADGNAAAAPELIRTLWSFALDGGPRGVLFWDTPNAGPGGAQNGSALINARGEPTGLAKALSPELNELSGATGQLLSESRRLDDGVAVLYSPASIRVTWLFEADKLHGTEWLQTWGQDSSAERRESLQLRLRESWGKLLDDCGIGWRFVSSRGLEHGELARPEAGIKTLILPRVLALSDREVEAVKQFAAGGGSVVADASCARFDEHGKLRARPALDDIFGVNTMTEPIFSRPMKALNRVTPLPGDRGPLSKWSPEFCSDLSFVFSDEPQWLDTERSGLRKGAEYRLSPVFGTRNKSVYLNLDLTDYLRWRLHPELPRAKAARKALTDLVFQEALTASVIDWSKTKLPHGTQIIRLRNGNDPKAATILALRRNPQARLHELGVEGDGNWAFEKPEAFEINFKQNIWLDEVYVTKAGPHAQSRKKPVRQFAGVLDPDRPTIVEFKTELPAKLELSAVPEVEKVQRFEIAVSAPKDGPTPALYAIRVFGPDHNERTHYGGTLQSKDGSLSHVISFALNDPAGPWTVAVHDMISGSAAEIHVKLKDPEKQKAHE